MKKIVIYTCSLIAVLIIAGAAYIYFKQPEFSYLPKGKRILDSHRDRRGYDLWGQYISLKQAKEMLKTAEGKKRLSPKNGTVKIDDNLLDLGRKVFYQETFGNEIFLTDIVGITDGAFTIPNLMKAIISLGGKGTNDLRVKLAKDVTIGDKSFHKGEKISTGIDMPKGSYEPLGMPVKVTRRGLKVGITCAACHATVDHDTKKMIEGAPNLDLNTGLILALAPNSTAYFSHAQIKSLQHFIDGSGKKIIDSKGKESRLPNTKALEEKVDETLMKWPPGNFDSSIDMKSNPTQIPDSFTLGDFPYGWSGFAMAGPFHGLSTFSTNVHAQNADSLAQTHLSKPLFGVDQEVYLGTILQNAADPKYRYDPKKDGKRPSTFFKSVDPTPKSPGVNELVKPPSYPKVTLTAPGGLIAGSPGFTFNSQNNAVAAWQNTIVPPKPTRPADPKSVAVGRKVFESAGCISCHAGRYLTNNRIVPVKKIGTEPSRAKAPKKKGGIFGKPWLYSINTPIPIPKNALVLRVPTKHISPGQQKLGFALGNSRGGYKTPSLLGLYWTVPYLHDGGVAVGSNAKTDLGMSGTLMKGILPDPANSLRALIDKDLRQKVIAANQKSRDLQDVHVKGTGHTFWVDETTGFTKKQQDALIDYLLSSNDKLQH